MEILFFLGITLFAFSIPLIALRMGKEWLITLLPIYLITANVFAESFLNIMNMLTSLAIPIYASTFLITDTLSEHFGMRDARRAVLIGFTGQLLFFMAVITMTNSPISPDKIQSYQSVFSIMPRLIIGSFTAYLISQHWDIFVYHLLKSRSGGSKKYLWLRNNISTISSQLLDSTIFILIAFYGRIDNIFVFIFFTWIFKILAALIDTPYMYLTYYIIGRNKRR